MEQRCRSCRSSSRASTCGASPASSSSPTRGISGVRRPGLAEASDRFRLERAGAHGVQRRRLELAALRRHLQDEAGARQGLGLATDDGAQFAEQVAQRDRAHQQLVLDALERALQQEMRSRQGDQAFRRVGSGSPRARDAAGRATRPGTGHSGVPAPDRRESTAAGTPRARSRGRRPTCRSGNAGTRHRPAARCTSE
jgi:hypothetical protein